MAARRRSRRSSACTKSRRSCRPALIDAYERSFASGSPPHTKALWSAVSEETGKVMAIGVRTLAMIWDAAWAAGGSNANAGRRDPKRLRACYEDVNFVRSVTVDDIEHEIQHPSQVTPLPH